MANIINNLTIGGKTGVFSLPYGTCGTAFTTAAKTVSVDAFALETGAMVAVRFANGNSNTSATLNVSGTGAKSIKYNGNTITAETLNQANVYYLFIYDGTNWELINGIPTGVLTTDKLNIAGLCAGNPNAYYAIAQQTEGTMYLITKEYTTTTNEGVQITVTPGTYVKAAKASGASVCSYWEIVRSPIASNLGLISSGNVNMPVYFSNGKPVACNQYAGGTAVTWNGNSKSGSSANFYAPATAGNSGQILSSAGNGKTPTWIDAKNITAGSVGQLTTARTLSFTGDATGSMTFDGSADTSAKLTLADSGVTANSYGPSTDTSPARGGSFNVPYFTVDAKGRITNAVTRKINLPTDSDEKVKNVLSATSIAYITGTTSSSTNTGTQVFNTGVYLGNEAGKLHVNGTIYAGSVEEDGVALKEKYAAKSHTHNYLPLTGGTMTGQIKTSFQNAVAVGSYASNKHTIPDLVEELRYSSGCMGSVEITTEYTFSSVKFSAGWYNYIYIPHRNGGINGKSNGDNCNYGTLTMYGMTINRALYRIRVAGGKISEVTKVNEDNTPTSLKNPNSLKITVNGTTTEYDGSADKTVTIDTTTASKLGTSTVGSATRPVYLNDGTATACTYTLGKSVPSDAMFTDTTYQIATDSAEGLMSASDKSKLDGIDARANSYTHPAYTAYTGKPTANLTPGFGGSATISQITTNALGHVTNMTDRTITIPSTLSNGSGTAGLIKTTSTVTSNTGYTACPVIDGVPYYKDTDTTNKTGASNTSSKIFLIGATSQSSSTTTYSHDTAYVGTDGCLYSGGTKVLTSHQSLSGYLHNNGSISNSAESTYYLPLVSGNVNSATVYTHPAMTYNDSTQTMYFSAMTLSPGILHVETLRDCEGSTGYPGQVLTVNDDGCAIWSGEGIKSVKIVSECLYAESGLHADTDWVEGYSNGHFYTYTPATFGGYTLAYPEDGDTVTLKGIYKDSSSGLATQSTRNRWVVKLEGIGPNDFSLSGDKMGITKITGRTNEYRLIFSSTSSITYTLNIAKGDDLWTIYIKFNSTSYSD